jgi:hypothetical protein
MDGYDILIDENGDVQFIYNDDLAALCALGNARTARASHVEPYGPEWRADLSPIGGPVLGPFRTRARALDAEVRWIRRAMTARRLEVR